MRKGAREYPSWPGAALHTKAGIHFRRLPLQQLGSCGKAADHTFWVNENFQPLDLDGDELKPGEFHAAMIRYSNMRRIFSCRLSVGLRFRLPETKRVRRRRILDAKDSDRG
jgi:hypothetical protein